MFLFCVEHRGAGCPATQPLITNFWDGSLFDLFAGCAALLFMFFSLFYCLETNGWSYGAFQQYCSGDALYNCGFFKNITNILSDPTSSWWQRTSNIYTYKKYFWIDQLSDGAPLDFSCCVHCFSIFFFLFIFSSILFYYTLLADSCVTLFFIICFFLLRAKYKSAAPAASCSWYDIFQPRRAAAAHDCATTKIILFYYINVTWLFMCFSIVQQLYAPVSIYTEAIVLGVFIFTAPISLFV